jgi:hypothetical protein
MTNEEVAIKVLGYKCECEWQVNTLCKVCLFKEALNAKDAEIKKRDEEIETLTRINKTYHPDHHEIMAMRVAVKNKDKEIAALKAKIEKATNLVYDDVPHQYQSRLLRVLEESK